MGSPGGSSVRSDRSNADLPPATAADIPALFKLFRKGSYEDARGMFFCFVLLLFAHTNLLFFRFTQETRVIRGRSG